MGDAAGPGWIDHPFDMACLYGESALAMVDICMSTHATKLPDDPAFLKAMIAALEAENAKISATFRAHHLLAQSLRARIAKLQKQAFGKRSEKIEREIEQLAL